jgi:DUF1680 family protein
MAERLVPVDLKKIRITDELFGGYARLISEKVIPYQWDILNDRAEGADPTYCMQNFRIAAGEQKGERKGVVFEDSDLYKWIEAASYAVANGSGDAFRADLENVIALLGKVQQEDGYLNTFFSFANKGKRYTNLMEGHELYCAGHLIEAAVAYTDATGDRALLQIAMKYADLICRTFGTGEGQIHGYPGHQEIELALVKLYRCTGEKRYLDTATYFIAQRGKKPNYFAQEMERRNHQTEFFPEFGNIDLAYMQADEPPVEQTKAKGHAVRAVYMYSAMADLAAENDDQKLLEACRRLWDNLTQKQMYITGSIGSSGFLERFTTDYDLPNTTNYSETCASIGLMMFGQRMCNLTHEASYYDIVERALYNTVLAGISQSGDRYFYVNPLEVVPQFCTEHTSMAHVKPVRQKWFSVACCPPNVARTLASLGQYIMAESADGLYIQQFISSELEDRIGTTDIHLKMDSQLLQSGTVTMSFRQKGPGIPLYIRIPSYAVSPELTVNGQRVSCEEQGGYMKVMPGKEICELKIDFHIRPRWMSAHDDVRADTGKLALEYGPCIYCLEEKDNGDHLSGIYVRTDTGIRKAPFPPQLMGQLPALEYEGERLSNRLSDEGRLYGSPRFVRQSVQLYAVPYGMWGNRGEGEMLVWQNAVIS